MSGARECERRGSVRVRECMWYGSIYYMGCGSVRGVIVYVWGAGEYGCRWFRGDFNIV